jgi:dTDP-4-dehydrorhamnose reductase
MRRILIVGGAGQLGTALRAVLADRTVIAPAHSELDIEDAAALAAVLDRERPDALINCSAFHNVDQCEREPQRAFAVNAVAVDAAARLCAQRDIAFLTVSTDYVFDGTSERAYREDDEAQPRTAYGVSKLAGELLARRHGPRCIIVRTSGVFGDTGSSSKGYTLIDKVLAQAERGEPTRMVADMTFSPSYAPDVAAAIVALLDAQAYGTHHLTNGGACSWFAFVQRAFAQAGLGSATLEAATYASMGNPTQRPLHSPLVNTTLANHGIAPLRSWEDAQDEYLARRRARLAVNA